jgi:hypothetical protein
MGPSTKERTTASPTNHLFCDTSTILRHTSIYTTPQNPWTCHGPKIQWSPPSCPHSSPLPSTRQELNSTYLGPFDMAVHGYWAAHMRPSPRMPHRSTHLHTHQSTHITSAQLTVGHTHTYTHAHTHLHTRTHAHPRSCRMESVRLLLHRTRLVQVCK